jgi:endonuclease III
MILGQFPDALELTEEEAFCLLTLCLMSPQKLDATSEKALRKLAAYCRRHTLDRTYKPALKHELDEAG